jgi:hypothetical protein
MSKRPNEWENFALTGVGSHPAHRPLDDLRVAVLEELAEAGQVAPWNLYFYLIHETGPIPEEIRNYLARLVVGQQKYKKPSGRKSPDAETKRLISKMVRDLFTLRKAEYVRQGKSKTDAKDHAVEDLAREHKVSESFIEKLVNPRNRK